MTNHYSCAAWAINNETWALNSSRCMYSAEMVKSIPVAAPILNALNRILKETDGSAFKIKDIKEAIAYFEAKSFLVI